MVLLQLKVDFRKIISSAAQFAVLACERMAASQNSCPPTWPKPTSADSTTHILCMCNLFITSASAAWDGSHSSVVCRSKRFSASVLSTHQPTTARRGVIFDCSTVFFLLFLFSCVVVVWSALGPLERDGWMNGQPSPNTTTTTTQHITTTHTNTRHTPQYTNTNATLPIAMNYDGKMYVTGRCPLTPCPVSLVGVLLLLLWAVLSVFSCLLLSPQPCARVAFPTCVTCLRCPP